MSDSSTELDIRWPIGLLFLMIGLFVGAYGALFASHPQMNPLGLNLDLWWGLVMLLFGLWMLWSARRASRKQ